MESVFTLMEHLFYNSRRISSLSQLFCLAHFVSFIFLKNIGCTFQALNCIWHMNHFRCFECNADLGGSYVEHEGSPYCKNCYLVKNAPKCKNCSNPITAGYINALGGYWHTDCFACKVLLYFITIFRLQNTRTKNKGWHETFYVYGYVMNLKQQPWFITMLTLVHNHNRCKIEMQRCDPWFIQSSFDIS